MLKFEDPTYFGCYGLFRYWQLYVLAYYGNAVNVCKK